MVCGFRIFPPATGGQVHSSTIARALARMGHEVLVYNLAGRREDYAIRGSMGARAACAPIESGLTEETNLGPIYGLLQTIARRLGVPRIWQHELLRLGWIPRGLREHLRSADIIVADFPFCPPIPGPWSDKPWFLVSHELECRLLQQGTRVERFFAPWMERIEREAPRRYRDIFVCAEEDREFFRSFDAGARLKLPYIRCGVDSRAYVAEPGARARVRAQLGLADDDWLLAFSGSAYGPNVEALAQIREFCRVEADFLARHRLYVLALGSMLAAPVREGAFIATGRVPDVVPYFAAADIGLNPITRGSGSNVKLFEYLAALLPVVSTPFGVRGTNLEAETDYLAYEAGGLRTVLERFLQLRTRGQWREHAAQVLARHFRSCDIQELVQDAVSQRPEFADS